MVAFMPNPCVVDRGFTRPPLVQRPGPATGATQHNTITEWDSRLEDCARAPLFRCCAVAPHRKNWGDLTGSGKLLCGRHLHAVSPLPHIILHISKVIGFSIR